MTEPSSAEESQPVPYAKAKRKRISPVWLVPIIALAIAVALGVRAWQQKGEEIKIIFDTAGGIEVGKTEIRLKDVPVGKVTKLSLSKDLTQVYATVTIDRGMAHHLSDSTRFWLVTPRISTSGISNLGTLVSGVYIVMDPGEKGNSQHTYVGLSEPPAVQSDEKGTQYVLRSDMLGSIDIGSPIYYRQLRVGEVVNYQLSEEGSYIDTRIFVEAPYDGLVSTQSRFWNVSGFDVSLGVEGVTAKMESISSLLLGGIAFESPSKTSGQPLASADYVFPLYAGKKEADNGRYTLSYPYIMRFSHSIKGLNEGAPIEFKGLKVGRVANVRLLDLESSKKNIEITVLLEPQRFDASLQPTRTELDELLKAWVQKGLRAQIKSANLLLGSKYIDLSFSEQAPNKQGVDVLAQNNLPLNELPTIDQPLDLLERQLGEVAQSISNLPINNIGDQVEKSLESLTHILKTFKENKTADALDGTLKNMEQASRQFDGVLSETHVTLKQLTQTLKSVDHSIAPDSQLHAEFLETLQAVSEASDSFDRFVEELYRYPSSLVFGLGKGEE